MIRPLSFQIGQSHLSTSSCDSMMSVLLLLLLLLLLILFTVEKNHSYYTKNS